MLVLFVPKYSTLACQVINQAHQFTHILAGCFYFFAVYDLIVVERIKNTFNLSEGVTSRHVLGLVNIYNLGNRLSQCLRLICSFAVHLLYRLSHEVSKGITHYILADHLVWALVCLVELVYHHLYEHLVLAELPLHHVDELLAR